MLPSTAPDSPGRSSVGGASLFSRSEAWTSRSIHAVPKSPPITAGAFRDNPELAARVAADQRAGGPLSPTARSVTSVTSSVRRRARASLHVLPKHETDPAAAIAAARARAGLA